ncbi:MAG: cadherin-like beta sandwich domain-containing protein [Clostridia bacterium]|nr:cadherin-like beta sandwich domain-containing protein [Clostridia bacterium]
MMDRHKRNKKAIVLLSILALIISAFILLCINPNTREIIASGIINNFFEAEILTPTKRPEKTEDTTKTSLLNKIYIGESEIQDFEPNKLNYEIMLNSKLSQILISVKKQDEGEKVTGIGAINLTGNSQRIEIKVTSSDGKSTTSYTITIKYKEAVKQENIYEFNYTGDKQEFIAPYAGYYQIECWGAKGGSYSAVRRKWCLYNRKYILRKRTKTLCICRAIRRKSTKSNL